MWKLSRQLPVSVDVPAADQRASQANADRFAVSSFQADPHVRFASGQNFTPNESRSVVQLAFVSRERFWAQAM